MSNPITIVGNKIVQGIKKAIAYPCGIAMAVVPAVKSRDGAERTAGLCIGAGMVTAPVWMTGLFLVSAVTSIFKR